MAQSEINGPKQPRKNRLRIKVNVQFGSAEPMYKGQIKDVSPNGMLIASKIGFLPDTILNIRLNLPNRKISVMGQVVWSTMTRIRLGPYNYMGIKLIDKQKDYDDFIGEVKVRLDQRPPTKN